MILNEEDVTFKLERKLFSIIIYLYNCNLHIEEAIDSIINQTIGFEENVQLILIDDGSDDDTYQIALKYENKFPNNILLISQDRLGVANAYNIGLKYAESNYLNFMESFDYLDLNALSEVKKVFSKQNVSVILLPILIFSKNNSKIVRKANGSVDLSKDPTKYYQRIYSTFFKKDIIGDTNFDSRLVFGEDTVFLNKILLKTKKYWVINSNTYYNFRKRNKISEKMKSDKQFYITRLNYFLKELIDYSIGHYGKIEEFIKILILKELVKLLLNKNILELLSEKEVNEFFSRIKYILSFFELKEISDIINYYSTSGFLIGVKNEDITLENIKHNKPSDSLKVERINNDIVLLSNNFIIDNLSKRKLFLDFVNLREDVLSFSGFFKSTLNKDNIYVSAIKEYSNGDIEIFDATFFDYSTRSTVHMMNFDWEYIFNFDLSVPIYNKQEVSSIKLIVYYNKDGKKIPIDTKIRFRKYCNISYSSHYYVKDNRIVMFNGKFNIMPYSYINMVSYELRGLLKIIVDRKAFFMQAMLFRIIYLILYPYMKNKEIWIIMDRKDAADDNGEHFYKYALKQEDGIKKFFSIFKDADDYGRLKRTYGNVLAFESLKHRFFYTFAKKLISSQGSEFVLNPFRHKTFSLTAGISNVDFYFLQHGIIKDNMSSWLRKYDRNPKLIVTSTQLEYESLFDEGYNYGDNVITLLGLPRYDNLTNEGYKKQIVIMPSWRNFLTDEKSVLNSEYYHRFNSLINNKQLINHAKEKSYEIIFRPHPELVKYLNLFEKNDYVKIDQFKKYQVVFNESAILVTDYSSIFFDFSYLKKPLIYYQYGNDYHFDSENGYFQYETMGFGPVIKEEDELVSKLIEYMDTGCVMEDIYKERVDKFFKYHDRNNSKRCYDWIITH